MASDTDTNAWLKSIDAHLAVIQGLSSKAVNAMAEAESEVPESIRRFANYFHDIVHIKGEYVTLGLTVPRYIDQEMERCDDRFRQLLEGLHAEGGAFNKIRREMAKDPKNRYDHTRQLSKPTEG